MPFETRVGWRYLYRAKGARSNLAGLLICLATMAIGAALLFLGDGSSGLAVIAFTGGMIGAVLFLLLSVFSVFTTVSVLGVVLGVAALIIVLSVTTGFQREFREKVLGVNANVIVQKEDRNFVKYREVEKICWEIDSEVRAVHPFIFVEMQVTNGKGAMSGVAIKGVVPDRVNTVLDLHKHLVSGTVDSLAERPPEGQAPPIILGRTLAKKLKAEMGDELTVVAPMSNLDLKNLRQTSTGPRTMKFRVSGIFYSGFGEYDSRLMYINIEDSRRLLDWGDKVMGIELKVADLDRASEIAEKLEARLREHFNDYSYEVQDWYELNSSLFAALTLQKIALLIVLVLIIAVATFNMVSALTMMVIDKTSEIAILKSMGATSSSIGRIFHVVGICIGSVGTLCGLAIGLSLCEVIARFNYRLDPKIYLIDRLPIEVSPLEVVVVAAITMLISGVATILPASRAAALPPVDGLRYD